MFYMLPAAAALAAAGIAGLPHTALRWGIAVILLTFGARSMLLQPPHKEAIWLQEAAAHVASQAQPGDVVFIADTHTLLFMQHHAPALARYRLVWQEPELPYFEGAAVIPDSLIADPEMLDTYAGRAWGMHTRHGGQSTEAIVRRHWESMDAERTFGIVTVWGPQTRP
jgi:hypothetical protein